MRLLGMHRRLAHALFACIALAVALLVPLRAWAAILPACENRELLTPVPAPAPSIMFADAPPAEPSPGADPSCVVPTTLAGARERPPTSLADAWERPPTTEDAGDPRVAPICDPRGASAVAP